MSYHQNFKIPAFDGIMQQEKATFGAGCFWCSEAIFQRLNGVISVVPGYAGGTLEKPSYEKVSSGDTGHAEVVQVIFDPTQVTYEELLEIFWKTHDPTTLNQQGNDVGTPYRSIIFYHTIEQKELADKWKEKLDQEKIWDKPIVTDIVPFDHFYTAEECYHNYYNKNKQTPYCELVIDPKIEKLEKLFATKLKK